MVLDQQQLIRNVLLDFFLRKQKLIPTYSLRKFAQRREVSSSALSEILRGKRNVSRNRAVNFAQKMQVNMQTMALIEAAFSDSGRLESLSDIKNPLKEIIIGENEQEIMADWLCFAIVCLIRTKGFRSDITWIAARLGVDEERVDEALRLLESAGTIHRTETGEYRDLPVCYRTSENFPETLDSIRQIKGLKNAITALEEPVRNRVGNFSTISGDPAKLKEAELLIEDFLKRLSIFLAASEKKEVFELSIQLFQLSVPVSGDIS